MKSKTILLFSICLFILVSSCSNSQAESVNNISSQQEVLDSSIDSLPSPHIAKEVFVSRLSDKWNEKKNEREVQSQFLPNIAELRKGNRVYQEHTIAASKLNEHEPQDVHIINFDIKEDDFFKEFLRKADAYVNLEAIWVRGIKLDDETIASLIEKLSTKEHFKKLIITGCSLKNVPPTISKLEHLKTLNLTNNSLVSLPPEICELKNLWYLSVGSNSRLAELPAQIGNLVDLEFLDFSGSRIEKLPATIGRCVNLIKIVGNACKVSSIPAELGNCKKLRDINLGANKIESVPPEIGNLTELQSLSLGYNEISSLPDSFGNLDKLTFCGLGHNEFVEFPTPVLGLAKVGNLWLHENSFTRIPEELGRMSSLHHFLVDVPQIADEDIKRINELNPKLRLIDE